MRYVVHVAVPRFAHSVVQSTSKIRRKDIRMLSNHSPADLHLSCLRTLLRTKCLPATFYLKGLGHAILGNCLILPIMSSKRRIGRPRVFHLQNHGLMTTENDFPAV